MQKGDKSKYLDAYRDSGMEPDPDWDLDLQYAKHIDRLLREAAIGWLAHNHPRRLGQGATPQDLAKDAKFSKRYGYGAYDMLKQWGVQPATMRAAVSKLMLQSSVKITAAQVDWEAHIYELCAYLRHEIRSTATSAHGTEHEQQAKRIILNLENELNSQVQRFENIFGTPINPENIEKYS